ncbi:hypothetical protein SDC9_189551 [bioreactor metagenome]|uniref:Uncharacterized protein n=1 Tax=bioreactor metagenome TaxID=1076179 RepID=A0A645HSH2_9ZZZZ
MAAVGIVDPLDLLSIPGGQSHEQQYADDRDDEVQSVALDEHIDHRCNDDAPQRHDEVMADAVELPLGCHTVQAHSAEQARRCEKSAADRQRPERHENPRQSDAVEDGVTGKGQHGCTGRHLLQTG